MTTDRHSQMVELAEKMNDICQYCGGLPSGLPPQVYDDLEECGCNDECTKHDFAYFCPICCGKCASWGCGYCEMNFDAPLECITCGVPADQCPECHELRPGDDRVKNGMRCGPCAYGGG